MLPKRYSYLLTTNDGARCSAHHSGPTWNCFLNPRLYRGLSTVSVSVLLGHRGTSLPLGEPAAEHEHVHDLQPLSATSSEPLQIHPVPPAAALRQ